MYVSRNQGEQFASHARLIIGLWCLKIGLSVYQPQSPKPFWIVNSFV